MRGSPVLKPSPQALELSGSPLSFPRVMSRASNLGMSEQQEIARTRTAGRIGSIMTSLVVLAMVYLTIRSRLLP